MKQTTNWREFWEQTALSKDPIAALDFADISKHRYRCMMFHIRDLLELKPQDRLLNIGVGTGVFGRVFADDVDWIVGMDFSFNMIQKAGENGRGINNENFLQADCRHLPFRSDFFDKVLCFSVTHYLDKPGVEALIQEALRVTRSGGRILIGDIQGVELSINKKMYQMLSQKQYKILFLKGIKFLFSPIRDSVRYLRVWYRQKNGKYYLVQKPDSILRLQPEYLLKVVNGLDAKGEVLKQNREAFYNDRFNLLIYK